MKSFIEFLIVITLCISTGLSASTSTPTSGSSTAGNELKLARLQIPFIKNVGQADDDVVFYADTFGGAVLVKKQGELELVVLTNNVPEFPESQEVAADHGTGESRPMGHLGDGQTRRLLGECANDRKSPFQTLDKFSRSSNFPTVLRIVTIFNLIYFICC